MLQGYPSAVVWLVVAALGVGTFGLRLSFIQLHARIDGFPPRIERALSFVPAAILAALVSPRLFAIDGSPAGGIPGLRPVAGAAAAVVAWRTNSMLLTIGVGMAVLWIGRLVLG